jgi:hypothetical protein
MSKHTHHQSKEEQIFNKAHGATPFHYENRPYQASHSMQLEGIQTRAEVDDSSIQLRAYQIHQEKGGTDLDNWLEAERSLNNKKSFSQEQVTMA